MCINSLKIQCMFCKLKNIINIYCLHQDKILNRSYLHIESSNLILYYQHNKCNQQLRVHHKMCILHCIGHKSDQQYFRKSLKGINLSTCDYINNYHKMYNLLSLRLNRFYMKYHIFCKFIHLNNKSQYIERCIDLVVKLYQRDKSNIDCFEDQNKSNIKNRGNIYYQLYQHSIHHSNKIYKCDHYSSMSNYMQYSHYFQVHYIINNYHHINRINQLQCF